MQIVANEEQIKKSLLDLNIPTLLMVMTQYAGDDRWLVDRYRPKPIYVPEGEIFPDDSGDYDDDIADEIRAAALELILKIRDDELPLPPPPSSRRMRATNGCGQCVGTRAPACPMRSTLPLCAFASVAVGLKTPVHVLSAGEP